MKQKRLLFSSSFGILFSFALISSSYASDPKHPFSTTTFIQSIGKVFLKGALDNGENKEENLYLVLGVKPGAEIIKNIAKWAIPGRDLIDDIYNSQHSNDLYGAGKEGWEATKSVAPKILSEPWKSIKHAPEAFWADIEQGNGAYYNSDSKAVGSLKFSGWAVWAVIDGSYYLIVQTSAKAAGYSLAALAALPGREFAQTLIITWDTTKIVFKGITGLTAATLVGTYSILSSSIATAAYLLSAGVYKTYTEAQRLPQRYFYPVQINYLTQLDLTRQAEMGQAIADHFTNVERYQINLKQDKYTSNIQINARLDDGTSINFASIQVYPEKRKVFVNAKLNRKYFKYILKEHPQLKKQELYSETEQLILSALAEIEKSLLKSD